MKPNFALSLSYEGIELLQRAAGGWLSVGAVPFDRPDLDTAIEALRQRALALAPDGLTTKLIVPDSEVRFATVLAFGPTDEARRYQIEAEVEGMTPYPLSDLAYDWSVEGDHAQVAIVARETLREAEEFATERGFNPVSFVALPGSGQFLGEPFFGQTGAAASLLAGGMVQPDADPVRILGKVPPPPAAPPPAAAPVAPPAAAAAAPKPPRASTVTDAPPPLPPSAAPSAAPSASSPVPPAAVSPASLASASAAPRVPASASASASGAAAAPRAPLPTAAPDTVDEGSGKLGDLVRRMGTAMRREQARQDSPAPTPASAAPASAAPASAADPADGAPRPDAAVVAFSSRRAAAASAPQPVPNSASGSAAVAGAPGGRLAILPRQGQGGHPGPGLAKRLNRSSRRLARDTLDKLGLLATVRRALGRAPVPATGGRPVARNQGDGLGLPPAAPPASAAPPARGPARTQASAALSAALAARPQTASAPPAPTQGPVAVPWTRQAEAAAAPVARAAVATASPDRVTLSEAEALTLFGRRGMPQPQPLLPARALMAVGAVLLVLVAVAVWALYFNRPGSTPTDLAQGSSVLSDPVTAPRPAESGIAAPPAVAPPDPAPLAQTAALPDPAPPAAEPVTEPAADLVPDPVAVADPEAAADVAAAPPAEGPAPVEAIASDPDARLEELVREALTETQPAQVLDSLPAAGQAAAETPAQPAADSAASTAAATASDAVPPADTLQPEATTEATALRLAMPGRLSVPPVDEILPVSLTPPPPFDAVVAGVASTTAPVPPQAEAAPGAPTVVAEPEVTVRTGRPAAVPAQRPVTIVPPAPVVQPTPAPVEAAPAAPAAEAAPAVPVPAVPAPAEPAPLIVDDTPRADPALAGARPEARSARVRALGEALRVVPVETPAAEDGADEQPGRLDQGSLSPDLTPALAAAGPSPGISPAARPTPMVPAALTAPAAEPADPQTQTQTAALPPGGVELSLLRPLRRPTDLVPDPAALTPEEAEPDTAPEAVARSLVPSARPRALSARVQAALEADRRRPAAATAAAATAPAAAPAAAAAPAPQAAAGGSGPSIPSSASVQQAATQSRAIRTREANLIGVFGAPSNRRALVRLGNGQVVRLQVGDRFDGGQVSAIGDSELRYVRGGRDQVLRIASRG